MAKNHLLLYFYASTSKDEVGTANQSALNKENLLLPPVITNNGGWKRCF